MAVKRQADESTEYKDELDAIGNETGDSSVTDVLKDMYVGAGRGRDTARSAGTISFDPSDDPPVSAINPDYPDEGFNSDDEEKKFFVDESEMSNANLDSAYATYEVQQNPAGKPNTAKRRQDSKVAASKESRARGSKEASQKRALAVQQQIANCKNLATLLNRKGLIAREAIASTAKELSALDNRAFLTLTKLVAGFSTSAGRQATASATKTPSEGFQTPIHLAKPNYSGQSLIDKFADAAWEGVPPKDWKSNNL